MYPTASPRQVPQSNGWWLPGGAEELLRCPKQQRSRRRRRPAPSPDSGHPLRGLNAGQPGLARPPAADSTRPQQRGEWRWVPPGSRETPPPPPARGRATGYRLGWSPSHRGRPLRNREDAQTARRMRSPPARGKGAQRAGGAGTAHVQPLPVTGGRRAPAMARRVVAGLLLLEAAGLLGALLLYRAMDSSQGAAGRPPVPP